MSAILKCDSCRLPGDNASGVEVSHCHSFSVDMVAADRIVLDVEVTVQVKKDRHLCDVCAKLALQKALES